MKKDRAQACGQVLSYLEETDWLEYMVGVLRGYVDFRETTEMKRTSFDTERRCSTGGCSSPRGSRKACLVVGKEAQTLARVKRWVRESVAPMLAVICAADPGGHAWLDQQIIAGKKRWKAEHWRLVETSNASGLDNTAGGHAGAPFQGGEGVRPALPTGCYARDGQRALG